MIKKKILACVLATVTLAFTGACGKTQTESSSESSELPSVTLSTVYNGGDVDILNTNLRKYLNLTTESEICSFLKSRLNQNYTLGESVALKWTGGKTPYTLTVSTNENLSSPIVNKNYYVGNCMLASSTLIPDTTYYYQIKDGNGDVTETDSFHVVSAPRILTVSKVKNVRDIGGWKTEDGKSVNFGKIIRSANVDGIDDSGKVTMRSLKIKTDLDLRTDTEASSRTASPIEGLQYKRISISMYDRVFNSNETGKIRQTFEFLADKNNYPVLLHCKAGADRTGTMAFLINGLCGVSYEDLTRDFEITSFSDAGARWRSAIVQDGATLRFDESGQMSYESELYVAWNKMYDTLNEKFPTESGKLSDSIKAYLLSIGVTEEQIASILDIMLN